jgi:hypothetical protein
MKTLLPPLTFSSLDNVFADYTELSTNVVEIFCTFRFIIADYNRLVYKKEIRFWGTLELLPPPWMVFSHA